MSDRELLKEKLSELDEEYTKDSEYRNRRDKIHRLIGTLSEDDLKRRFTI